MTTEDFKRKLAAILNADVKGYSRLIGEDEDATVSTLNAYREVMGVLIQKHRGQVMLRHLDCGDLKMDWPGFDVSTAAISIYWPFHANVATFAQTGKTHGALGSLHHSCFVLTEVNDVSQGKGSGRVSIHGRIEDESNRRAGTDGFIQKLFDRR